MNRIWIKVVLAISLDGRIALPNGGKAQLGSKGDRRVLEESLAWADATLMGGETLRMHKNTCLIHEEELIRKRILEKRPDQPISLVVTRKQNHHLDWPFFKQPINRWMVSSKENFQEMHPPKGYDHFVELKSTWAETFSEFIKSGLTKIVILGGAKLVGSVLIEDQVDELQLTLTPKLLGGLHSWTPHTINNLPIKFSKDNSWIIKEIKEMENNEIMLRYFKK